MNDIGNKIKELRIKNNLSQLELANILYVSNKTISSWENNRTNPDINFIFKLCDIFHVSFYSLVDNEYCNICYQETNYYTYPTDLFSELARYRVYKDVESGVIKHAYLSLKDCDCQAILTKDFESKNIVLNPYGTYKNKNGYDEVRKLFFLEAIKNGQPKAKQLVLSKFNKM